jgi:hypothetical protein
MNPISPATRYWIESAAAGAFSFRFDGERLTTAQIEGEPVTTCASTYNARMARGWVKEIH